jgi:hypothetical protein
MHLPDNRPGHRSGRERVMLVDENHQVDDFCERLRVLLIILRAQVQTRRISGTTRNVVDVDTLTDSARCRRVLGRVSQSSDRAMVWYELLRSAGGFWMPFRVGAVS